MSAFTFTKATKKQAKARIALSGPSGSGKTTGALVAASVLAGGQVSFDGKRYSVDMSNASGPIAVIDTEKGSASLYADQFEFDVLELAAPYSPDRLGAAIKAASDAGYATVVIDGLTPFWNGEGGVLDIVEAAAAKSRGNTYAGWKEGTPAQNRMIQVMLDAPCHVVATMRSKQDYVQEQQNGRTVIRKVGMAPVQRDGLEYEFTIVGDLDLEHNLVTTKSRCPEVADRVFRKEQVVDFAAEVAAWLGTGAAVEMAGPEARTQISELAETLGLSAAQLDAGCVKYSGTSFAALTAEAAPKVIAALNEAVAARAAATPDKSAAAQDEVA